jgi:dihydroorotate dehydrogenase
MKVKGVEITDSQIAAMHNVIGERFRASDVTAAAEKAGVSSGEVAMRAADRILQKLRKDKKIQIIGSGPYWKRGD